MILFSDRYRNIRSIEESANTKLISIAVGEFAVASDSSPVVLRSLLGSCVSVMLYDKIKKIRAMNHFLLPKNHLSDQVDLRYGHYSIEIMVNEMIKLGCNKKDIAAKIAGGCQVIHSYANIGYKNMNFAREYCTYEKIEIIAEKTNCQGGIVVLLGINFNTVFKNVEKSERQEKISAAEKEFTDFINQNTQEPDITLF